MKEKEKEERERERERKEERGRKRKRGKRKRKEEKEQITWIYQIDKYLCKQQSQQTQSQRRNNCGARQRQISNSGTTNSKALIQKTNMERQRMCRRASQHYRCNKKAEALDRSFYWIQDQVARIFSEGSGRKTATGHFFTKRAPNHEHNGYMNIFTVEIKRK